MPRFSAIEAWELDPVIYRDTWRMPDADFNDTLQVGDVIIPGDNWNSFTSSRQYRVTAILGPTEPYRGATICLTPIRFHANQDNSDKIITTQFHSWANTRHFQFRWKRKRPAGPRVAVPRPTPKPYYHRKQPRYQKRVYVNA